MTVQTLLSTISSSEIAEWMAYTDLPKYREQFESADSKSKRLQSLMFKGANVNVVRPDR